MRPPLQPGTHGEITLFKQRGAWQARCRYRDYTGTIIRLQSAGKSKSAAQARLIQKIRDQQTPTITAINRDTTLTKFAPTFWEHTLTRNLAPSPSKDTTKYSTKSSSPTYPTYG